MVTTYTRNLSLSSIHWQAQCRCWSAENMVVPRSFYHSLVSILFTRRYFLYRLLKWLQICSSRQCIFFYHLFFFLPYCVLQIVLYALFHSRLLNINWTGWSKDNAVGLCSRGTLNLRRETGYPGRFFVVSSGSPGKCRANTSLRPRRFRFSFFPIHHSSIVMSLVGDWRVTYRRVLDWMTGFIDTLFTQLGTTGGSALSPMYRLYSLPLHTH
jgi:hypothetical protein